jgi:hypothetical protein
MPIRLVMRLRDLFLLCLVLASIGVGVFELGRHVDSESNTLAGQDSDLNQPVYRPTHRSGPSRRAIELGAGAVGGTAGVLVLFSIGSALARPRRRKATWRASS